MYEYTYLKDLLNIVQIISAIGGIIGIITFIMFCVMASRISDISTHTKKILSKVENIETLLSKKDVPTS